MNNFDGVTNREEFDRALESTIFSSKCKGSSVLNRLLEGDTNPPPGSPNGPTREQIWGLLVSAYALIPSSSRTRFESGTSSTMDAGSLDVLKESFESLKTDLLATIERRVEDKVSEILDKKEDGNSGIEDQAEPVLPMKHYVDIKLEGDDPADPVCPKKRWAEFVKPKVESALKGVPVLNTFVNKGSVRLSFETDDQLKAASAVLSPALGHEIQTVTERKAMLDPRIAVNDLDLDLLDEGKLLSEILSEKNQDIKKAHGQGGNIKVIHVNRNGCFAVLQVSPDIRRIISSNKDKVFLKLRQHTVRDRFHVVQCFHCQEFGHVAGSMRCSKKDSSAVCAFCAGNHETRQCQEKRKNDVGKLRCINCHSSGSREDRRHSKTHLASSTLCPFYINERGKLMDRTAGVSKETKNVYRTRAMEELRIKRLGGSGR
jgi:hypothetical protein